MMITHIQETLRQAFYLQAEKLPDYSPADFLTFLFAYCVLPLIRMLITESGDGLQREQNTLETMSNPEFASFVIKISSEYRSETDTPFPNDDEILLRCFKGASQVFSTDPQLENIQEIREGFSALLKSIGTTELILNSAIDKWSREIIVNLLKTIIQIFPELAWMDEHLPGQNETKIIPTEGVIDSLALMHIPAAELMTNQPSSLTSTQRDFLLAIQNWHISEINKVEIRTRRWLFFARLLMAGVALLLLAVIIAAAYGIRTTIVARNNASVAATNAGIAGQVARVAGTDVVIASTARVASTQSLATAQVASTAVVQENAAELAAQSQSQLDKRLDLALLLGVESFRSLDTYQTRNALFSAIHYDERLTRFVHGHHGGVLAVAYSPDGRYLASAGEDAAIILTDLTTGKTAFAPLTGHTDAIYALSFSTDGRLLVSGGRDKKIILWDLGQGKARETRFEGHTGAIYALSFSPDGTRIVSASEDKSVRIWDAATGKEVGSPKLTHTESVTAVTYSPDGRYIASAGLDKQVILWNAKSGTAFQKAFINAIGPVWALTFSPDSHLLAAGGADAAVHLWDVSRGGSYGNALMGHRQNVLGLDFSSDGKTLVSAGDDGIILWRLTESDGQSKGTVWKSSEKLESEYAPVRAVAFSPDGTSLAAGSSIDATILIWDVRAVFGQGFSGGAIITGHTDTVSTLQYTPDGKTLVSGSWDGTLRLWDLSTTITSKGVINAHEGYVTSVAISPDGKWIASGGVDKTIRVWSMDNQQPAGAPLTGHEGWVSSVVFRPQGDLIVSAGWDKTVRFWKVNPPGPIGESLSPTGNAIYSLAFNPAGDLLAIGSEGGSEGITIWRSADFGKGDAQNALTIPAQRPVNSIAISPDGKTLASGGADKKVSLWNINDGKQIGSSLAGHSGDILDLALSPDGKMVASGGSDGSIILWDVQAGLPLGKPLRGHTNFVYAVSYRPDGKVLASGSADKNIVLWPTDPQYWIEQACQKVGRNLSQTEWEKYFPMTAYHKTCPQNP